MTEPPDPERMARDRVAREAAAWVVRVSADPGERPGLDRWLANDPAHRDAYDRALAVWLAVGAGPAKGRVARRAGLAIAACLTLALGLAALWSGFDPIIALRADHRTALGEVRTIALSAEDQVELNAASAIAVDYGPEARRVTLLAGEAVFTVAHDPQRPFVAEAGAIDATALGTVYAVRRDDGAIVVSVIESRVAVDDGAMAVALDAGQAVRYRAVRHQAGAAALGPVEPARLAEIAAWRQGRLRFEDRPVAWVLKAVNRHRPGRVLVFDPALADRRISGVIPFSAMAAAPRIIADQLGARVIDLSPLGAVILPAE